MHVGIIQNILFIEMLNNSDKKLTKQTLNKYGLTEKEWQVLYDKYGGACHLCRKKYITAKRNLHIDHEHVPGWKNLPPDERKKHIRGLTCYTCNRFRLTRGTTLETAKKMVTYFKNYEKKKLLQNKIKNRKN